MGLKDTYVRLEDTMDELEGFAADVIELQDESLYNEDFVKFLIDKLNEGDKE